MARTSDMYGVEKIILSDPDVAGKPASTTPITFTEIREDTVKFTVAKSEATQIYTETNRNIPYRIFSNAGEAPKIDFAVYASFEQLAALMGGTATSTSYTPPTSIQDVYKKVEIYTRETDKDKNQMILSIPYANIQTGIEGSLKYNDLGYVEVTATAMKRNEGDVPYTLQIKKRS